VLSQGDTISIRRGAERRLRNDSAEPAHILIVTTRNSGF
jgi:quercetin dioxygenase-like cupin family protein